MPQLSVSSYQFTVQDKHVERRFNWNQLVNLVKSDGERQIVNGDG